MNNKTGRPPREGLKEKIIELLQDGPKTRPELVEITGIPRTSLYDGLKDLIVENRVKRYPLRTGERKRGRPQVLFALITSDN